MAIVFLVAIVVFGAAGYAIGRTKNRAAQGLVLGLVLGIIGLIILAFLKPRRTGGDPYGQAPPPYPQQQYPPPSSREYPYR